MKGLELSRKFYETFGVPMLETEFAAVLPYVAVGLMGSGSECCGYDDDISCDHDFEPGFCIIIPDESVVDRKTAFQLERAYAKLPKEFMGIERARVGAVGGNRHGVIRMDEFFEAKTGRCRGDLSIDQWFAVPEQALLESVNGAVFVDHYGEFTRIREMLRYFPEDIRRKKMAGHLLLMGQAGQYNYPRCLSRGDTAAAQLAVIEFVRSALSVIFLLNRTYQPYYKWCFRALKELPLLSGLAEPLEKLISTGNEPLQAAIKQEQVEAICWAIAEELRRWGFSAQEHEEMERWAYAVNDTIEESCIRNLHILYGV